jgi:hypothetical protein
MGRRGGKGKGDGRRLEDQYGESSVSQDREQFTMPSGGMGAGRGGGEAGGRKKGADVTVIKHIPKFLQAHKQFLEPAKKAPVLDDNDDGWNSDDDGVGLSLSVRLASSPPGKGPEESSTTGTAWPAGPKRSLEKHGSTHHFTSEIWTAWRLSGATYRSTARPP